MAAGVLVKTPKRQKGLALLVLVIVIMLGFASYMLSGLSINQLKTEQERQTRLALKKAKQALLAYAMNYPDTAAGILNPNQGPGNFPCPDDDLDGDSDTPGSVLPGCNSTGDGTMGRFPWAELAMDEVRDGNGEFLWYAVSSNFTNFANGNINTSTTGEITIRNADGTVQFDGMGINGVVAVIISPGKELVRDDGLTQSRTTVAEIDDPQNYLDIAFGEDNAAYVNSDADGFITAPVRNAANDIIVNDLLVVITYEEIMELVHARVGEEISNVINSYFVLCDAYPEASVFNPTKVSFASAGLAPPPGSELREGHLPLDSAEPYDWGGNCGSNTAPVPPQWLAAEGWHRETYYTFAYRNPPPSNGSSCGAVPNPICMTVNNANPAVNNAQALVIFSGRDITGGRPSITMSDYFEGENNNLDNIYDAGEADDYIRMVTP